MMCNEFEGGYSGHRRMYYDSGGRLLDCEGNTHKRVDNINLEPHYRRWKKIRKGTMK
jgi:hypothetical protein